MPEESTAASQIHSSNLTDLVIQEVFQNFHLKQSGALAGLLHLLMRRPAGEFAKILQRIDQDAFSLGLHGAAMNVLHRFVTRLEIRGWETPLEGPLLITANHPGGTDPFVMASAIARRDMHFLSQDHIVFDVLPNLKSFLICTAEDRSDGHIAIRKILSLLKERHCVLIYPGGDLELDPALFPKSGNLLRDWSRSIGFMISCLPEVVVQPVVLRGTISSQAWKSRLARISKSVTTRLQIAMILQIAMQQIKHDAFPVQTTLIKGEPIRAKELDGSPDPAAMQKSLMAIVNELVGSDPSRYPLLEEIVLSA
jgi:1-acyl-sn-glycerol-3-phosphate acyltransferase